MYHRQQQKGSQAVYVPEFKFYPVKLDRRSSLPELVSSLKRLITEAQVKSAEAEACGRMERHADIRITMAYASQRLRDVVDGNVRGFEADQALRASIKALDHALHH